MIRGSFDQEKYQLIILTLQIYINNNILVSYLNIRVQVQIFLQRVEMSKKD
jgi:hypothetical protein